MRMEDYFQTELRYLREQGEALSQAHPELSHYLAGPGADPDVERLLEGVAFLTASVQARLDDSFPELSLGVLQLVAPQLLRVIPSLTMMQFMPIPHTISQPMRLDAGCEMASDPVEGRSCRFRTCRAGWIYPADSQLSLDPSRLTLTLSLKLHTRLCQTKLALDKLHLYLGDELPAASELYLWLREHLQHLMIETGSGRWQLPADHLQANGFTPAEALLPEPDKHIDGHRLLQEYYSFPQAFLCLGIIPTPVEIEPVLVDEVQIRFIFCHPLPGTIQITPQSIRINCIPAANLFSLDAEPIHRHGRHHDYPLALSYRDPEAYELFSIDSVQGWSQRASEDKPHKKAYPGAMVREFQPFHRFHHTSPGSRTPAEPPRYKVHQKQRGSGDGVTYRLSFIEPDTTLPLPRDESISIALTCCDRRIAAQLAPGAIHLATGSSPHFVQFRNLLRPTTPSYPATEGMLFWQLLNQLSHHYQSLLEPRRLQELLRCYDRQDSPGHPSRNRERIAAIQQIDTWPIERIQDGLPIRGIQTRLGIHGYPFGGEGELYLFGTVLAQFLAHYASINSFHQLELINLDSQASYRWPATAGRQPLL